MSQQIYFQDIEVGKQRPTIRNQNTQKHKIPIQIYTKTTESLYKNTQKHNILYTIIHKNTGSLYKSTPEFGIPIHKNTQKHRILIHKYTNTPKNPNTKTVQGRTEPYRGRKIPFCETPNYILRNP